MTDIEKLKEFGSLRKYSEDDFICYEGEPGNEMFIILTGKVNIYITSVDGFPIQISEVGPAGFFGEMSLLEDQPRSASVVAASNTIVLAINKENFQSFICNNPSMAYKIMKGLSSRIRSLNNELKSFTNHEGDSLTPIRKQGNPVKNRPGNSAHQGPALFPPGHKSYSLEAPYSFSEYIYTKEMLCPVCDSSIHVKMQRLSKLKLSRIDFDFRKRYSDFDPLWYLIWVCPHCYYANFQNEFKLIPGNKIIPLLEKNKNLKEKYAYTFSEQRDINHVFASYYLAIHSAKTYSKDPLKFAKLWMHLTWLYQDVHDQEMVHLASSAALENYYNAFYHSKLNITIEYEQEMNIILGELFLMKGNVNEALKHFYAAKNIHRADSSLVHQAEKRIAGIENNNLVSLR
ncbi:MAG: DUF2225 domain-containing protein [Clostridia bacterium]|nr:DUF2225 domain-containing protein [Clostridia bacterium]